MKTKDSTRLKRIRPAIVRELKNHADARYRIGAENYFKEGIALYGVRAKEVRRIAACFFAVVRNEDPAALFALCEELLSSPYAEEKTIAFAWAYRLRRSYEPKDFRRFESWLKKYVSNWGACDDLCRHAFGAFIYRFPERLPRVKAWTRSKNRWLRRAAAVIMIYSLRKGVHLDFAFQIADALLRDEDYLVQNGYGWMLKDASIDARAEVLEYVTRHKNEMPRRALRYAIERFTPLQRRRIMS